MSHSILYKNSVFINNYNMIQDIVWIKHLLLFMSTNKIIKRLVCFLIIDISLNNRINKSRYILKYINQLPNYYK